MKQIKTILYILILISLVGCIKPYEPEFKEESVNKYVVEGGINSVPGLQQISISITSSVTNPHYIPVDGCRGEIIDELGNSFPLEAFGDGKYGCWMTENNLVIGRAYMLKVILPDGDIIESKYDRMPSGPEVDDIYYEVEDIPTNTPGSWVHGLQFYTNLRANETDSKYYRWRLIETWESHTQYPKEFYYDGEVGRIVPPDSSKMYCWTIRNIDEIFTLTTENFSSNEYEQFPLHFIPNTTAKLAIQYSLLVQQIALSQDAYTYWDQLRINSSQDGGLYNTQPIAIKGNMENINNPDKEVLGFFQAYSLTSRRIFVGGIGDLNNNYSDGCQESELGHGGFLNICPCDYPAYLLSDGETYSMTVISNECVDCTLRGGSTIKPDYWPTK